MGERAGRPTTGRAIWPWLVWGGVVLALFPTLLLSLANRSLDEDPLFIPIAIVMILGYATAGAILSSRIRGNPVGWLLLAVGVLFVAVGLSDEYLHAAVADGSTSSLVGLTGLLSSLLWLPMLGIVSLLILLFPTGRAPGRRWRPVTWAIVSGIALFTLASTLNPGPLDPEDLGVDRPIENPLGVAALDPIAGAAGAIGTAVVLLCIPVAIAGMLLRFRRSTGEERQQLRWLAYVVVSIVVLVVLQLALALVPDGPLVDIAYGVLWIGSFALVGLGIPITIAIAILRYRLYDLDVVVKKTVVFVVLVVLLMAVSLGLLLALSSPLTDLAPDETQAVGITGLLVGLSAWPLWHVARRIADRMVYGGRATPYEILSEFSGRVGETYSTDDVLPRMAQLLGEATGATTAVVWLQVGDGFRAAARWPAGSDVPPPVRSGGTGLPALPGHAVEVRHQGELLGALSVDMPASDPMRPSKERIVRDLAAQAGLVLRNVRLIEELRESRRRIVAAQDDRARALERNIHDGAQQQLVALTVKARLAGSLATKDPERTSAMLEEIQIEMTEAMENLRDLARGIYPPLLADQGLAAALSAQARKSPVPVAVNTDGTGRYPADIEATVYFSVLEALQNVAKYAEASTATVTLAAGDEGLRFAVTDDGRGFDATSVAHGTGLQGIADRLSAVGGELAVTSSPDRGTTVSGRVPAEEVGPA